MADIDFFTDSIQIKTVLEETIQEVEQMPQEYLPNLLQIIRLFRESVTLPSAESSFRQGWQEAMTGNTIPVSQLWDGIDAE
ncbi:MAG: hypothetical protein ACRC6M_13610 [Microcystaceae cyanobacterium]